MVLGDPQYVKSLHQIIAKITILFLPPAPFLSIITTFMTGKSDLPRESRMDEAREFGLAQSVKAGLTGVL